MSHWNTCPVCNQSRPSISHVLQHGIGRTLKCIKCGFIAKSKEELISHTKAHHPVDVFDCFLCDKRFNTIREATAHFKTHRINGRYQCPICPTFFKTAIAFKHHVSFKHKYLHNCELCNVSFGGQRDYWRHISVCHLKPVQCDHCDEEFDVYARRQKHMVKYHSRINRRPSIFRRKDVPPPSSPLSSPPCSPLPSPQPSYPSQLDILHEPTVYKEDPPLVFAPSPIFGINLNIKDSGPIQTVSPLLNAKVEGNGRFVPDYGENNIRRELTETAKWLDNALDIDDDLLLKVFSDDSVMSGNWSMEGLGMF